MKYNNKSAGHFTILLAFICCSATGYSQKVDPIPHIKDTGSQKEVDLDEYFQIFLTNSTFSVSCKHVRLPITNIQQLDDYLRDNIQNIDIKNLGLGVTSDVDIKRTREVREVLKKHGILHPHFMMIMVPKSK